MSVQIVDPFSESLAEEQEEPVHHSELSTEDGEHVNFFGDWTPGF